MLASREQSGSARRKGASGRAPPPAQRARAPAAPTPRAAGRPPRSAPAPCAASSRAAAAVLAPGAGSAAASASIRSRSRASDVGPVRRRAPSRSPAPPAPPAPRARRRCAARHHQHREPAAPRPPGAAGAVQQHLGAARQVGVQHQVEPRQVDAARREVGRDADPRPPLAHRRQRRVARRRWLSAPESAATAKPRAASRSASCRHRLAPAAEDDRRPRLVQPQQVDDRRLPVRRRHRHALQREARRRPPRSSRSASRWNRRASASTSGPTVAENISVCRPAGSAPSTASSSARKSAPSIWSASSSTTQPTAAGQERPGRRWSPSRPGVPDHDVEPARPAPPARPAGRRRRCSSRCAPRCRRRASRARPRTCMASSRVGATTSARGPAARAPPVGADQPPRQRQPEGHGLARAGRRRDQQVARPPPRRAGPRAAPASAGDSRGRRACVRTPWAGAL